MNIQTLLRSLTKSEDKEQKVETDLPYFEVRSKAIAYGNGSEVYPLGHVTRFGKYKVLENKFPLLAILLFLVAGFWLLSGDGTPMVVLGVLCLLVAGYGIYSRTRPGTYAFGIETASGSRRYVYSKNPKFIDEVLQVVSTHLEKETSITHQINMNSNTINLTGGDGSVLVAGDVESSRIQTGGAA